ESEWATLERHLSNAESKAQDVDRAFSRLRDAFDRIEEPTVGGASGPRGKDGSSSIDVDDPGSGD
ncbi:MAG: hypothetical protein ABEJ27_05810, partial [Halodesulfurarchaeum sp.]